MKPLPRTARPDPYIENGEYAYLYEGGRFRKIKSDHHTGGGSFQYNFCDTDEVGCCGWSHPYLLSRNDLEWFKKVASRYGSCYYTEVKPNAVRDEELAYLICWFESADLDIQLHAKEAQERGKKPLEYCLDTRKFLAAIKAAEL